MKQKMTIKLHNIEQRTSEWALLRQKHPLTASNAQAIGNQGKGLETLVWGKLAELHSSGIKEEYTNKDMERGIELEEQARSLYELETGNVVEVVGFVTNEKLSKFCGASPDGLVGKDGLVEIKCFEDVKHFKNIVNGVEIEPQYVWQIQMQLLITNRDWCDFVVYNPNYEKSLLIKRVTVDQEMQKEIMAGIKTGERLINDIEKKYVR